MIRFTWVQTRTQTIVAVVALAIVAIALAITGPHLVHLYNSEVVGCAGAAQCASATTGFLRNDSDLRTSLDVLVVVVPGITGLFWGAPLVARELEVGTFRLAWTQGVSRTRWLAVKLGLGSLMSMAVAGLLTLFVTWWASPLDRATMDAFKTFDQRDIVPIGYAAFAFALGVGVGAVLRRMLPAMATTLVLFAGARLAVTHWLRPHLISPVHLSVALDSTSTGYGSTDSGAWTLLPSVPNLPNAWLYSTHIVNGAGQALSPQFLARTCPLLVAGAPGSAQGAPAGSGRRLATLAPAEVQNTLQACVTKVGTSFHEVVVYQPANRYWALQWCELAVFIGAALVVGGASIWWIRHRIS